jgi:hypothetical protein
MLYSSSFIAVSDASKDVDKFELVVFYKLVKFLFAMVSKQTMYFA